MKAIKIIAGILILGILLLAFIANQQYNRAEWWRSKPMRDARHKKKGEELEEEPDDFTAPTPEPEPTPEPLKVVEEPKVVS